MCAPYVLLTLQLFMTACRSFYCAVVHLHACVPVLIYWQAGVADSILPPSSPVFSLGQRRVVVLVEVCEGRLRGLEQREALNAAENADADPSAGLPPALAAAEHEVRPALEEGVVVLSGLPGAVCRHHSVPRVLLDHDPTPVD